MRDLEPVVVRGDEELLRIALGNLLSNAIKYSPDGGKVEVTASLIRGEGWIWGEATADPADQRTWLPWLEQSAERFVALLRETPEDWLTRRVDMIDTPGATLSGWRLLMMMIEHEVHHRSQIDSYAGLQGWPVPDIFNRSAESIDLLQSAQRARHGR